MRKLPSFLGIGLLAVSIAIGGIACADDDEDTTPSDTPTAVAFETPTESAPTTPSGTETPAGTAELTTPTVEPTTTGATETP